MARKYVALATVDYIDTNGKRQFANPARKGKSGIFSADYDTRQEQRLIDRGAIRRATNKDVADDKVVVEAAPAPADDDLAEDEASETPEDLNSLTVVKLKALAEAETIDLGAAKSKDEIIGAIIAGRAAKVEDAEDLLGDDT